MPATPATDRAARSVVTYTLARAGLLAVCLLLGWVAGLRGVVLVLVGLVASGLIALVVLQRQRLEMSATVDRFLTQRRARAAARTAAEDAYVDDRHDASPRP